MAQGKSMTVTAPAKASQLILLEKYQKHAAVTPSFAARTAAVRTAASNARPPGSAVRGASVGDIGLAPSSYSRSSMGQNCRSEFHEPERFGSMPCHHKAARRVGGTGTALNDCR